MIRIGFEQPGDNPISKLIAGFDPPQRYSHAFLLFGQDLVCEAHAQFGVRFQQRDVSAATLAPVPILPPEEEVVRRFCELQTGDGYDLEGVLAIARLPLARPQSNKWFCSELVCAAVQQAGFLKGYTACRLSPNGLWRAWETQ